MLQIDIDPMDTLFFRDSRPFTAGENTTAEFNFPSPMTLFGAIGSAILDNTPGVELHKFFSKECEHPKLGRYDPDLKDTKIKIKGPFLHNGDTIFFPPPANLWVRSESKEVPYISLPHKNEEGWEWDIGKEKTGLRPLKIPSNELMEPLSHYISKEVLASYLSGGLDYDDSVDAKSEEEFFLKENRYGHVILKDSLTVDEGYFYSAAHMRFKDKLEKKEHIKTGFTLFIDTMYLFSWDDVPGNDSNRLKDHLVKTLEIDWAENAEIKKNDTGKTITVNKDENSLKLELDEEKNKVILNISSGKLYEYTFKKENGKLNIYDNIDETDLPSIISLGGERRKAMIKLKKPGETVSAQPEVLEMIKKQKKFFIYLATPAIFKNGWNINLNSKFKGAVMVGAAVNKPIYISGWKTSEKGYGGEPRPIKKAVPAGSVYFFEGDSSWNEDSFENFYKKYNFNESLSDEYPSAGFGIGLIGSWNYG